MRRDELMNADALSNLLVAVGVIAIVAALGMMVMTMLPALALR